VQLAASVYTLMQSALAGAERIYGIMDEPAEPEDRPDALDLRQIAGRIDFESVYFGYDPARPVLHDLTFSVEPGQTVALVGRTGAGKTTVASLIPRFYDADRGTVSIDGNDVRQLNLHGIR